MSEDLELHVATSLAALEIPERQVERFYSMRLWQYEPSALAVFLNTEVPNRTLPELLDFFGRAHAYGCTLTATVTRAMILDAVRSLHDRLRRSELKRQQELDDIWGLQ